MYALTNYNTNIQFIQREGVWCNSIMGRTACRCWTYYSCSL